jgi:hypothetical protein
MPVDDEVVSPVEGSIISGAFLLDAKNQIAAITNRTTIISIGMLFLLAVDCVSFIDICFNHCE